MFCFLFQMLGFFISRSGMEFMRKSSLASAGTRWQVSPARSPSCDRQSCSCPTTSGPRSWTREKRELTVRRREPSPPCGGSQGAWREALSSHRRGRAGEQAARAQPPRRRSESHRFVIRHTASLCAAHTANPCAIFLSVFPPPPTVLPTSLHTGETQQLRKQPSGG